MDTLISGWFLPGAPFSQPVPAHPVVPIANSIGAAPALTLPLLFVPLAVILGMIPKTSSTFRAISTVPILPFFGFFLLPKVTFQNLLDLWLKPLSSNSQAAQDSFKYLRANWPS